MSFMQIMINNQRVEQSYRNIQEFDLFWREMTQNFFRTNQVIQCVEINGQKLFLNFEQNIVQNFNDISELNILTISEHQLLEETVQETTNYLSTMLNEIKNISAIFYGELKEREWEKFSQFVQGIEWIYVTIQSCDYLIKKLRVETINYDQLNSIKERLEIHIRDLEDCLNNNEYITVGDLIEYEFDPLFTELKQLFKDVRVN